MALADFTARAGQRTSESRYRPVAVVDIGSNSVRLVIYEGAWCHAAMLHNEKAICAIGRNMVSSGRLDEDGMLFALETLGRFRQLCESHGVREMGAVATSAARDAANGRDFIRRAEKALGHGIDVLSGEDEARIAAEGTLAGIPDADGLAADLGGGSLDMVTIRDGRPGAAATLPYGPLRLMDVADGSLNKARNIVEKGLSKLDFTASMKGRALYAVGGIWRALAHVDMEQERYPLRVLHHYVIPAGRAVKLARVVSGLSRKSLEKMRAVPKRRAEALPYGALVMEEMVRAFGFKEIVISAFGLREGVLQQKLAAVELAKDPLIEFARDMNARESRNAAHAAELCDWMAPLFAKEGKGERRVREAACLMSDIAWRRHPDDRAMGAFVQALLGNYAAADHHERVMIAAAVFHRYAGEGDFPEGMRVLNLLGADSRIRSLRIGLAARLAFGLSGAVEGELRDMKLHVTDKAVTLDVPARRKALLGETVNKRLADLAKAFDRKPIISV